MYSTNPGENFIFANSLLSNQFYLEIKYCLNKKINRKQIDCACGVNRLSGDRFRSIQSRYIRMIGCS